MAPPEVHPLLGELVLEHLRENLPAVGHAKGLGRDAFQVGGCVALQGSMQSKSDLLGPDDVLGDLDVAIDLLQPLLEGLGVLLDVAIEAGCLWQVSTRSMPSCGVL